LLLFGCIQSIWVTSQTESRCGRIGVLDIVIDSGGANAIKMAETKRAYDPKMVYVPRESPQGHFRTTDKTAYRRGADGVIRRLTPKKQKVK